MHRQDHQWIPCILLECLGSTWGRECAAGPIPQVLERIPPSPTTGLASKQHHHIHITSAYYSRVGTLSLLDSCPAPEQEIWRAPWTQLTTRNCNKTISVQRIKWCSFFGLLLLLHGGSCQLRFSVGGSMDEVRPTPCLRRNQSSCDLSSHRYNVMMPDGVTSGCSWLGHCTAGSNSTIQLHLVIRGRGMSNVQQEHVRGCVFQEVEHTLLIVLGVVKQGGVTSTA